MTIRQSFGSLYRGLSQNTMIRGLREIPLVGTLIHAASHLVLPWNTRVWVEVEDGLGKGLKLHLNPRYDLSYWDGNYETALQSLFAKYVTPGAVVYDVGANIGFFSLLAARFAGAAGKVFAFEPDPDNAERIRQHAHANGITCVSVIPSPVWSSNVRVFFARSASHSTRLVGAVQTSPNGSEGFYQDAITLDQFAKIHVPPTFLKMDIEGGETEALAGASEIFNNIRPVLLLEVHSADAEQFVRNWLNQRGYTYERLDPDPAMLPFHVFAQPARRG